MSRLFWDKSEDRLFEAGLDRGVLYINGKAVPWNGLVSVDIDSSERSSQSLYFNGMKTFDVVSPGDFSASIKAITYPDEFAAVSTIDEIVDGMYFDNQPPKTFGLSFRTRIGNDELGTDLGYKLHLMYNLTALPDSINYESLSSNIDPIEFGWSISSIPDVAPLFRPTAHIIFDSTKIRQIPLSIIEDILYGTDNEDGRLPLLTEIIDFFKIIFQDNGDGTWTAEVPAYLFTLFGNGLFEINAANSKYLDSDTYQFFSLE